MGKYRNRSQFRVKKRGFIRIVRFRVGLEGALVSVWELAWAVAVAVDLEVGHFGDGDPREGSVHVNAEIALEFRFIGQYLL